MAEQSSMPGTHPDDPVFDEMELWAGRRPVKQLVIELAVRVAQLGYLVKTAFEELGLGADGKYAAVVPVEGKCLAGVHDLADPTRPCPSCAAEDVVARAQQKGK